MKMKFKPSRLCTALLFALLLAASAQISSASQSANSAEVARWQREAQRVTIIRDDWGIAHVYGKSDADAVFGMIYAQSEDDFHRVEMNYINAMGRLAEAEGESAIYQDLRMKLYISPAGMKKQYAASPAWLKVLMNAWADGLNFYLHGHPAVKPEVIQHFEPWMALSFTEGSIGGDIERIDLAQLQAFYGKQSGNSSIPAIAIVHEDLLSDPGGSNGIAIAPANTIAHHALLLINPHTSFFFRSELQMASDSGLDAYGAVTWGQLFIYQGFNDHVGWMHTSSGADTVDQYLETVRRIGGHYFYRYGRYERPITTSEIVVPYKTTNGMAQRRFTVYHTHHGPIIREQDGKWVSIRMMQKPVQQLMQSFLRTKARSYKAYRQTMELKANSSNNTVFADADGDIAYFHGNFIPRRDPRFDFTRPVDGSDPATEWQGELAIDETPHLLNPRSGWLYNSNNWPWSAAGSGSPRKEDYPAYVETGMESARGIHAIRLLRDKKDFTLESLVASAYDSYLPWFAKTIPALLKAWDETPTADPLKSKLAEQISLLRSWDMRWNANSVPTSLAVFWGEELLRTLGVDAKAAHRPSEDYIAAKATPMQLLQALAAASGRLTADFGSWKTPWGEINRYQRINGDIVQRFDDQLPSIPVAFTAATWGSLASFAARAYPGTKKWYGTSGNSFVAAVEFGPRIRAVAVTAGGESGDPRSPHFNDQALRYATGNLREVYFYRAQLNGHIEREYHPGR